jgi:hypothetical protein
MVFGESSSRIISGKKEEKKTVTCTAVAAPKTEHRSSHVETKYDFKIPTGFPPEIRCDNVDTKRIIVNPVPVGEAKVTIAAAKPAQAETKDEKEKRIVREKLEKLKEKVRTVPANRVYHMVLDENRMRMYAVRALETMQKDISETLEYTSSSDHTADALVIQFLEGFLEGTLDVSAVSQLTYMVAMDGCSKKRVENILKIYRNFMGT